MSTPIYGFTPARGKRGKEGATSCSSPNRRRAVSGRVNSANGIGRQGGVVVRLVSLAKIAFAAMLVLHCGEHPASRDPKPGNLPPHPSHEVDSTGLSCPEDTREIGAAPPKGLEQYCAIIAEDGSQILHGPSRTCGHHTRCRSGSSCGLQFGFTKLKSQCEAKGIGQGIVLFYRDQV